MVNDKEYIPISGKLFEKIRSYCELNDIDLYEYAEEAINSTVMVDMYGSTPFSKPEQFKKDVQINVTVPINTGSSITGSVVIPESVLQDAVKNFNKNKDIVELSHKDTTTTTTKKPRTSKSTTTTATTSTTTLQPKPKKRRLT